MYSLSCISIVVTRFAPITTSVSQGEKKLNTQAFDNIRRGCGDRGNGGIASNHDLGWSWGEKKRQPFGRSSYQGRGGGRGSGGGWEWQGIFSNHRMGIGKKQQPHGTTVMCERATGIRAGRWKGFMVRPPNIPNKGENAPLRTWYGSGKGGCPRTRVTTSEISYAIQGSPSACGWLQIPGASQVEKGENTLVKTNEKHNWPSQTAQVTRQKHRGPAQRS